MKATGITQTKNMIIELIKQPLSGKIEATGAKIHDALINGAIDSVSEGITDKRILRLIGMILRSGVMTGEALTSLK